MKKFLSLVLLVCMLLGNAFAIEEFDARKYSNDELRKIIDLAQQQLLLNNASKGENDIVINTNQLTAEQITTQVKSAGFPMKNIIVYTEDTDPNNLLGRPNGYISKVNFADTRCEQYDSTSPEGGTVEVFSNVADCNTRKKYLESVYEANPQLQKYIYQYDNVLIRLSRELTPTEAREYENAFVSIFTGLPIKPYEKK